MFTRKDENKDNTKAEILLTGQSLSFKLSRGTKGRGTKGRVHCPMNYSKNRYFSPCSPMVPTDYNGK